MLLGEAATASGVSGRWSEASGRLYLFILSRLSDGMVKNGLHRLGQIGRLE